MAVVFISGKPGGGKSMRGVMEIIEELRNTNRNICTNLPLKLPEMAEYLHKEYGQTFDMRERIRLLEPEEVLTFWLYPAKGVDLTGKRIQTEGKAGRKIEYPDFTARQGLPGTVYVLDECHLYFSARNWQNNGSDGFYYLSQHRHFNDEVFLLTQFVSNVDKLRGAGRLRGLAPHFFGLFRRGLARRCATLQIVFREPVEIPASRDDAAIYRHPFNLQHDLIPLLKWSDVCFCRHPLGWPLTDPDAIRLAFHVMRDRNAFEHFARLLIAPANIVHLARPIFHEDNRLARQSERYKLLFCYCITEF